MQCSYVFACTARVKFESFQSPATQEGASSISGAGGAGAPANAELTASHARLQTTQTLARNVGVVTGQQMPSQSSTMRR